jgi:plasmid replication initiation protein
MESKDKCGDYEVVSLYDSVEYLTQAREYNVTQHNDLIQHSRFTGVTLLEEKLIRYLISKNKPETTNFTEGVFDINEYLKITNSAVSGRVYSEIKEALKGLRDRSFWVHIDGSEEETTLAWFDKVTVNLRSGKVVVKFDDMLRPLLLELGKNFTSYQLLYILPMTSKYSIRLYDFFKSYEYKTTTGRLDVDELKQRLNCECYKNFAQFNRTVLKPALDEINKFTDIKITCKVEKKGRAYKYLTFNIRTKKDIKERIKAWEQIDKRLNPANPTRLDAIKEALGMTPAQATADQ